MILEGKIRVEDNTKITNVSGRSKSIVAKEQGSRRDLGALLQSSD
jgi:hypothetical protein